jgi:hypothetical protein
MILIPIFGKSPQRRDFLTGGLLATIAVLLPSSTRIPKTEIYKWIAQALAKRRSGAAPNYERTHRCSSCNREYLCPDRYLTSRCEPTAHAEEKGWATEPGGPCGTCIGHDAANRNAWWEAHGV